MFSIDLEGFVQYQAAKLRSNVKLPPAFYDSGAIVISYFNSQSAVESPFRGVKVTSRPSLTANTLSLSKYGLSESNICVVMDLCPSAVIYTIVGKSLSRID